MCEEISSNDFVSIVGQTKLALEGDTVHVKFTCSSELSLNGSATLTCMSDGHWDPDPRIFKCNDGNFNYVTCKRL